MRQSGVIWCDGQAAHTHELAHQLQVRGGHGGRVHAARRARRLGAARAGHDGPQRRGRGDRRLPARAKQAKTHARTHQYPHAAAVCNTHRASRPLLTPPCHVAGILLRAITAGMQGAATPCWMGCTAVCGCAALVPLLPRRLTHMCSSCAAMSSIQSSHTLCRQAAREGWRQGGHEHHDIPRSSLLASASHGAATPARCASPLKQRPHVCIHVCTGCQPWQARPYRQAEPGSLPQASPCKANTPARKAKPGPREAACAHVQP